MHLVNVGSQLWTSLAEVYTAGETEASAGPGIEDSPLRGTN